MVPQAGAQAAPFCVRVQVTPLLVASFVTVAVNCWFFVKATLAEDGDTETVMGRMVMGARPKAPLLVTEVAWTYTPRNTWKPVRDGLKSAGAV